MTIIRKLIRSDGSSMDLPAGKGADWLRNLIRADQVDAIALPTFIAPLHMMLTDLHGYNKRLPLNLRATKMYLMHSTPGAQDRIRGDVVIVPAEDLEPAGR
jgi:hypothetical protein